MLTHSRNEKAPDMQDIWWQGGSFRSLIGVSWLGLRCVCHRLSGERCGLASHKANVGYDTENHDYGSQCRPRPLLCAWSLLSVLYLCLRLDAGVGYFLKILTDHRSVLHDCSSVGAVLGRDHHFARGHWLQHASCLLRFIHNRQGQRTKREPRHAGRAAGGNATIPILYCLGALPFAPFSSLHMATLTPIREINLTPTTLPSCR